MADETLPAGQPDQDHEANSGALVPIGLPGEVSPKALNEKLLDTVSAYVEEASAQPSEWGAEPAQRTKLDKLEGRITRARKRMAENRGDVDTPLTIDQELTNLLSGGDDVVARKLIDKQKDPETKVGLLAAAAKHFFEKGDEDTGKSIITQAKRTIDRVEGESERMNAQLGIAQALAGAERNEEAIELLQQVVTAAFDHETHRMPKHRGPAHALLEAASLYIELGEVDLATDALKVAQKRASLVGTEVDWSGHVEARRGKQENALRARGEILEQIALGQLRLGNVTEALAAVADISSEVTPERHKVLVSVVQAIVDTDQLPLGIKAEIALRWLSPMDPEYIRVMTSLGQQRLALASGAEQAELSPAEHVGQEAMGSSTALVRIPSSAIASLIPSDPKSLEALVSMVADPAERANQYTDIAISLLGSGNAEEGMRLFEQILQDETLHAERASGGYMILKAHSDRPGERRFLLGGYVAQQLAEQGHFDEAAYVAHQTHLGEIIRREGTIPDLDPLLDVAKAFQRKNNLSGALEMLKVRLEDFRADADESRKFWLKQTGQSALAILRDDQELAKRLSGICSGLAIETQTVDGIDQIYAFMNSFELVGMKQPNLELRVSYSVFVDKLIELGDFDKALAYAKLAPTRGNSLPEYASNSALFIQVAFGHLDQGRIDIAEDYLHGRVEGVSILYEDNKRLRESIAKAKIASGDVEAAREFYTNAWHKTQVGHVRGLVGALKGLVEVGLDTEALTLFQEESRLKTSPEELDKVAVGLTEAFISKNKIDQAIELADSITDDELKKSAFMKITKALIASGQVNDDVLQTVATEAGITDPIQLASLILDIVESNLKR